jgi:hypothetical protein
MKRRIALFLYLSSLGCPHLPPVSGCEPTAQTCIQDSPHVCSASQRWERAGDLTCAAVGAVCVTTSGVARCVAATDAGVEAQ